MPNVPQSPITAVEALLRSIAGVKVLFDPPASGPSEGQYVPWSESSLDSSIIDSVSQLHPSGLFTHQHKAIENVIAKRNTVVATRTSSGKSLTFALPAIHATCRNPDATALFLYPQKALAGDQELKLDEMVNVIAPLREAVKRWPFWVGRYDGSTTADDRKAIRAQARILLTNPDMLHLAILQHHDSHWRRFFTNLEVVAIDECHEYRGVFGTGVAHVVHRLRQICRIHGSDPTFVASSATIADPQGHLQRMTGLPFDCVDKDADGSRQGRRKFWMVGGQAHFHDIGRKLATRLADAGQSVLVFCPSRTTAERMLARLRKSDGSYDKHVAVYRSGLSTCQRSEIEQGLRDGTKRLVFSTTALELGIDIGKLDVVLCIGLPGSMMGLWQRAGRVARAGREGAIILVPGNSPMETHYASHPEEYFARENEPISINLNNARLAVQHYVCAINEAGHDATKLDVETLGGLAPRIHDLSNQGKLEREEFYRSDPHGEVNLRNSGDKNYTIADGQNELGEIGVYHLLRETPRNGIYRHYGQTYRVLDIIRSARRVCVRPDYTRNETAPYIRKDISIRRLLRSADYPALKIATVRLEVNEYLVALTEKSPTGAIVQTWTGTAGTPNHKLPTEGTMLSLAAELEASLRNHMGSKFDPAWSSCERIVASLFPTISGPCDPQDYSSGTTKLSSGQTALVLYDMAYDGVELTQIAFDHMPQLVATAISRVRDCDCETDQGCIRCVQDPRQDHVTSKSATLKCLQALSEAMDSKSPRITEHSHSCDDLLVANQPAFCKRCGAKLATGAKFCSECATPTQEQSLC